MVKNEKIRKKIMKCIRKNFIITWGIGMFIYAIIIHFLFSLQAPTDFLVAKWTAGEMLTYASTATLSLLALWQNKRFKEENDISQKRLENLSVKANELSAINKIIEIESRRLECLKDSLDLFTKACDIHVIYSKILKNMDNGLEMLLVMNEIEMKVDEEFFKLCRELRIDAEVRNDDDDNPIKNSVMSLYRQVKDIIPSLKDMQKSDIEVKTEVIIKTRNHFLKERENYIEKQEKKLNRIMYGNLDLESIKELYSREI